MKLFFGWILALLVFCCSALSQDNRVLISLPPDATGDQDSLVAIPLIVGDLSDFTIATYGVEISFDNDVLQAVGVALEGTLSEGMGTPEVEIRPGTLIVGLNARTILTGRGSLVDLLFKVVGQPGQTTLLDFEFVLFNNGLPKGEWTPGAFTVNTPQISAEPTALDFNKTMISQSNSASLRLLSIGTGALQIQDFLLSSAAQEDFQLSQLELPAVIQAGRTLELTVHFTPLNEGQKQALLQIHSNDPATPVLDVPLRGEGILPAAPDIELNRAFFSFGEVSTDSSAIMPLAVRNGGNAPLELIDVRLGGQNMDDFVVRGQATPFEIAPDQSAVFLVSFKPLRDGERFASMQLTSNDPDQPVVNISLTGTGVAPGRPKIEISPTTVNFGLVPVDSVIRRQIEIINIGGTELSIAAVNVAGADAAFFTTAGFDAPFALSPNSSRMIEVGFEALEARPHAAWLAVASNDSERPVVLVALTGTAVPPIQARAKIRTPAAGAVLCGSAVQVIVDAQVSNGIEPLQLSCFVNGQESEAANGVFIAELPLTAGENLIVASCNVSDSFGRTVVVRDSVEVTSPQPLACDLTFLSPVTDTLVHGDSIEVVLATGITGGAAPFTSSCHLNGIAARATPAGFVAVIPLQAEETLITARCSVIDSCGSLTTCVDSVLVRRGEVPVCGVEILTPSQGSIQCGDSVRVVAALELAGGSGELFSICSVNGFPATTTNSGFEALVPFPENGLIVAMCRNVDDNGTETVCSDTVKVTKVGSPVCSVEILSPLPNAAACMDSVPAQARLSIEDESFVAEVSCAFNDFSASLTDSGFVTALLPGVSGNILAECHVMDSCGTVTVCKDSVQLRIDNTAPSCSFEFSGTQLRGSFFDRGSGIARVEIVEIRNGELIVDDFSPGAPEVDFRIEVVNPNRDLQFSIDVFDACGNQHNCDPLFIYLPADNGNQERGFLFPSDEHYLEINNKGLDEIRVDLNGEKFKLITDALIADTHLNSYEMPTHGILTIDLKPYLRASNSMWLSFEGDLGTSAQLKLSNEASTIDHVLEIREIPEQFNLFQNYPNPFNPVTRIRFDLPREIGQMAPVRLVVYNLRGERVRTVLDKRMSAGSYTIEWDGKNASGEFVSSGIYIYRLEAEDFSRTRRMLFLK